MLPLMEVPVAVLAERTSTRRIECRNTTPAAATSSRPYHQLSQNHDLAG